MICRQFWACAASVSSAGCAALFGSSAAAAVPLSVAFPDELDLGAAAVCASAAQKQPAEQQRLVLALLKAYCVDDLDLIDRDVLRRLLLSLSSPADELLHGCLLPEVAALLQHITEQAIAQGVWKTPCIAVGDELFIGCVPIEQVESALLALRKSASPDPKPDRQGG
ncbi:MAG: DsbA family protein [Polyangia bacterium]